MLYFVDTEEIQKTNLSQIDPLSSHFLVSIDMKESCRLFDTAQRAFIRLSGLQLYRGLLSKQLYLENADLAFHSGYKLGDMPASFLIQLTDITRDTAKDTSVDAILAFMRTMGIVIERSPTVKPGNIPFHIITDLPEHSDVVEIPEGVNSLEVKLQGKTYVRHINTLILPKTLSYIGTLNTIMVKHIIMKGRTVITPGRTLDNIKNMTFVSDCPDLNLSLQCYMAYKLESKVDLRNKFTDLFTFPALSPTADVKITGLDFHLPSYIRAIETPGNNTYLEMALSKNNIVTGLRNIFEPLFVNRRKGLIPTYPVLLMSVYGVTYMLDTDIRQIKLPEITLGGK